MPDKQLVDEEAPRDRRVSETEQMMTPLGKAWTATGAAVRVGVSSERLMEMAESAIAPHLHVDGGPPLFKLTELKEWLAANRVEFHEGVDLPRTVTILQPVDVKTMPLILRNMDGIAQVHLAGPSGVYFLCRTGEVVYVGQSRIVMARIGHHIADGRKLFDSAYYIPVPISELYEMEHALIDQLTPEYNRYNRRAAGLNGQVSTRKPDNQAVAEMAARVIDHA